MIFCCLIISARLQINTFFCRLCILILNWFNLIKWFLFINYLVHHGTVSSTCFGRIWLLKSTDFSLYLENSGLFYIGTWRKMEIMQSMLFFILQTLQWPSLEYWWLWNNKITLPLLHYYTHIQTCAPFLPQDWPTSLHLFLQPLCKWVPRNRCSTD